MIGRVTGFLMIVLGIAAAVHTYYDPSKYLGIKPKVDFWTYLWIHFEVHSGHYLFALIMILIGWWRLTTNVTSRLQQPSGDRETTD